ncbi:hypothetical protein ACFYZ9_34910 [Streptomyces sp. NPDC001691]|uniref:hypothetical protein n=1 Tax=Streptomyces sp. NPDC001691 TaxID=3364600 RepID=UPI00367ABC53
MPFPLSPGATISRADLHQLVGGRPHGRISPSKTTPNICLFTSPGAHDSQHDGWTGRHYHFQGEGQGDREQAIKNGNRALADHAENEGRTLRLFSTVPGPSVRYLGAYRLDSDIPYVQTSLPVIGVPDQPDRTGYVFRLAPEDGTPPPSGVFTVDPISHHTIVRERDLDVPFRPRPGDERGRERTFMEDVAEQLLRSYSSHLRSLGHDVRRHTVTPARELIPLPVDLIDHSTNEIVACAGSAARTYVRAAYGELLDMRRFFNPTPRRVMLLPSRPRPDLADLCGRNDITVVWPTPGGFERAEPDALIRD